MSILDMQVRLYMDRESLASGTPEWSGSLDGFWDENPDSYNFGEIRELGDELLASGWHHGGGGASPEFWLLRAGAGVPKGWDVAETSVGDDDPLAKAHDDRLALVAALRGLVVWAGSKGGFDAPCWAEAVKLLAAHGARV